MSYLITLIQFMIMSSTLRYLSFHARIKGHLLLQGNYSSSLKSKTLFYCCTCSQGLKSFYNVKVFKSSIRTRSRYIQLFCSFNYFTLFQLGKQNNYFFFVFHPTFFSSSFIQFFDFPQLLIPFSNYCLSPCPPCPPGSPHPTYHPLSSYKVLSSS